MSTPGVNIIEYTPEDMTVSVGAEMTLAALQLELGRHRQWLPIDPPHSDRLTIHEVIDSNTSGPRRFAFGTIRDHLIGITVRLADGRVIHSGGKVVKNVAGYDLLKLFVGAKGSLGTVMNATFKLRPLPETERFVQITCRSLEEAGQRIEAIIASEVTPVVLDFHNLSEKGSFMVVVGFAGTAEEVDWQLSRASSIGLNEPSSLDYTDSFLNDQTVLTSRLSVLPSKMIEAIRGLNGISFVARAGNGVIYHRGPVTPRDNNLPLELMRRVKDAFDPTHKLPEFSL